MSRFVGHKKLRFIIDGMHDSYKQEIFNLSFSVSIKNENTNLCLFGFVFCYNFHLL